MSIQSDQLKERTMSFSITVLRAIDKLPRTPSGDVVARQLAKSATSVSSNYRAACICRSRREFIAKLGVVLEEADESVYWMDVILRAGLLVGADTESIRSEALQLRAIFARSVATARANYSIAKSHIQAPK